MKGVLSNIGLYIIGGIIGLLLLEVYYQVVEIQLPYHELNPLVGKKMIPSKRINYFKEGFYLGASNKYGYLGNPYPPARDTNNIRIALLGDSFTEGFHVFEDHYFGKILENKLNHDHVGHGYEVMNFGVGNYNYNDMIIQYKNFVMDFDPDILVFIVHEQDFVLRDDFFIPSPILKMKDDSLVIDYSFTQGRKFRTYKKLSFLMENSCIFKALNSSAKMINREAFKQVLFDKFYRPKAETVPDKDVEIDPRIFKSFKWFDDKQVFFVFKEALPPEIKQAFVPYGVICTSVEPELMSKLGSKGINYRYWPITNTWGHWNHEAQKVVADYLYGLIKQYEQ
jgi:hypothetical protein